MVKQNKMAAIFFGPLESRTSKHSVFQCWVFKPPLYELYELSQAQLTQNLTRHWDDEKSLKIPPFPVVSLEDPGHPVKLRLLLRPPRPKNLKTLTCNLHHLANPSWWRHTRYPSYWRHYSPEVIFGSRPSLCLRRLVVCKNINSISRTLAQMFFRTPKFKNPQGVHSNLYRSASTWMRQCHTLSALEYKLHGSYSGTPLYSGTLQL